MTDTIPNTNLTPKEKDKLLMKALAQAVANDEPFDYDGYSKSLDIDTTPVTTLEDGVPTWEKVTEHYLPDKLLAQTLNRGLTAFKIECKKFPLGKSEIELIKELRQVGFHYMSRVEDPMSNSQSVTYARPDYKARIDSVDKSLKAKGRYKYEEVVHRHELTNLTDEQLLQLVNQNQNKLTAVSNNPEKTS